MGIVATQNFDNANAETLSFNGDDLGARGIEIIISQGNPGIRLRVEVITSTGTIRYFDISPVSTTVGARLHIGFPVNGGTIRVIFVVAALHRGRVILHDEAIRPFGHALIAMGNQVILAAGAGPTIQHAQRACGIFSYCQWILQTTRPGHIEVFDFYEGATFQNANVLAVTGVTGGYVVGPLFQPPNEVEIYLKNDDGVNANTMTYVLMGLL